ncbi:MAG TPA: FCD domain-containing protein [Candidatus Binataceae bacterium]|nr:FCD domain-containing protein [Candidatus Binataceae bacterium]
MHGLSPFTQTACRIPYFRLNRQLHFRIVGLAQNPILTAAYRDHSARIDRARSLANFGSWRWQESVEEHEFIMAALRARDPRLLADRLEEHSRRTGEAVVAALARIERADENNHHSVTPPVGVWSID